MPPRRAGNSTKARDQSMDAAPSKRCCGHPKDGKEKKSIQEE